MGKTSGSAFSRVTQSARRSLAAVLFTPRLALSYALRQASMPRGQPKLFFIGFNKTGTKSLHKFFRDNGYLSVHHATQFNRHRGVAAIAKLMQDNRVAGRPILTGIDHYDVYSDMIHSTEDEFIEANAYFRELSEAYPNAYFVFNDRPVEKWLRSRLSHEGGPRGSLVKRFAMATGVSEDAAPDVWRAQYHRQKADVTTFFEGNPRFMIFDIESGSPEDLARFLAPAYRLDERHWSHHGRQELRHQQR